MLYTYTSIKDADINKYLYKTKHLFPNERKKYVRRHTPYHTNSVKASVTNYYEKTSLRYYHFIY